MNMSLDPLVLETARQEWLPRAEAGDFVAMAYLAIVRYLANPSPEADTRGQINNWLRRAMSSDDPEFLIALAEELVIGTAIYRDIRLARDFLERALSLSELKGSYAMARFTVVHDRKRCLLCLERAADLGHVPSRQVLIFLRLHKKNRLSRHLHGLRHLPKMIGDAQKVFRETAVREHWWRYKDVVLRKEAELYTKLGEDRRCYFSWARPSSIATFSAVMAKGHADTLMRGTIEADALRPKAVDEALKRPEVSQTPVDKKLPGSGMTIVRMAIGVGVLIMIGWSFTHLFGIASTPPTTVRDAPPKAIIKVAIHLKDGSGLFETIRPDDFGGISGDRTLELSEPPAKPGELIRGVFLTLEDFDGKNGAAAIGVVPFGWTGSPIELKIPGYGQCAGSGAVAQIADMNICTHQNQNG